LAPDGGCADGSSTNVVSAWSAESMTTIRFCSAGGLSSRLTSGTGAA